MHSFPKNNIIINIDKVDRPRGAGGSGKMNKIFGNIRPLFEAFLAFLDTY